MEGATSKARTDYKIPESVLVVIHTAALEILLLERAGFPGFWQSVTGSRASADEPLWQTALREVQEETGITARREDLHDWRQINRYPLLAAWRHRYAPRVTHNTEHVFSLMLPGRAAELTVRMDAREHCAWQWCDWRAAADMCFSPSNAAAIRALAQGAGR